MYAIRIEIAANENLRALAILYREFHEFHVRGVPDRLRSQSELPETNEDSELYREITQIIEDDAADILIAVNKEQVIGLAEVYLHQDEPVPLRRAYRYGYLQSLIVSEAFRGRGVGEKLLEEAQKWSRERDAEEMRIEIWEFAGGPLKFYEKRGYRTLRRTLVAAL